METDPQWYRDAVIYQLHIKAFQDSDGNGTGDFNGIIRKLDYLQSLGITAIWVLPFFPSPLRDDGYDIADYYSVHPQYNTLREFKHFLREAHKRGLRVIIELVINHTSDQHPWFQRARTAKPGSVYRDFYVWSDTADKYQDARIIFKDFETSNWSWDPVAKAYYWHRFYSHQPDLNFENPRVQKEVLKVLDFWLGMGVDGARLDAIPYLYEREGTNCENLPETHELLKKLRAHVDSKYDDKMLLAEANQWPEDAVAYFGEGDECHMSFHFPIMPRMFMAVQMEDRFPLTDILDQTPDIPDGCQWAIFLRNHDELTLEMVTDEERDYMYKVYARDPRARINLGIRRRLAPLLKNNRRKIELMNFLLFSLPGTPIIYYGDEIGMGDNYYLGDRDGVRTPMQWSPDRNAGFSRVSPQKLYLPVVIDPEYHYEAVNVENQESNASSLLWWMRRMIAMRQQFKALGRGTTDMLYPDNPKVLAFLRKFEDETVLVVANLSRFSQVVHLDLAEFEGWVPEEAFSRNRYPAISSRPYLLTLGLHDYYWFRLLDEDHRIRDAETVPALKLRAGQSWVKVLDGKVGETLRSDVLPPFLNRAMWFRGRNRKLREIEIVDRIPVQSEGQSFVIVLLEVVYTEGNRERYILPLSWLPGELAQHTLENQSRAVLTTLRVDNEDGLLFDALYSPELNNLFLKTISGRRKLKGKHGSLVGLTGSRFRKLRGKGELGSPRVLNIEQSNSSILYGDKFFFKLYRLLEEGQNPDVELTRFLTGSRQFENVPPYAGMIEYRGADEEPMAAALLQGLVSNQGDAWTFAIDMLEGYVEQLLTFRGRMSERRGSALLPTLPEPLPSVFDAAMWDLPENVEHLFDSFFLEMVSLLGQRTAEMHQTLASDPTQADWRPETFSTLYQRSMYQSMRSLTRRTMTQLKRDRQRVPESDLERADWLLNRENEVLAQFERVRGHKIDSQKIRIHGDFHLGQVLFTGKDFVVIDFEGEPARTLSERRLKRSPLRDVASMIRSFHYVTMTELRRHEEQDAELGAWLRPWLDAWYLRVSGQFLRSYREHMNGGHMIPDDNADFALLLNSFLVEKAVYELGYELTNRPERVWLPLCGLESLLAASGSQDG
ncbi:maltose alpha-D-glucosyltransferase [bacterium]|nr:maltose alpha-D-glucosyltransferase [bacterium]